MAPSETTNPRKRKQPPFNPPRPKTNGSSVAKSKAKASASTRKANIGSIFNEGLKKSKAKSKPKVKAAMQRPTVWEREVEEEDEDDAAESPLDDKADGDDGGTDDDEDEEDKDENENENDPNDDASDADMMLAEVTHDAADDATLEPAIPIPLLHRLMHHSFKNPEETKLSTDARACVGRYIETFIREGIARCALEVSEKVHEGGSDSALGHDDGWLEVEDLERVGGQLVLDF